MRVTIASSSAFARSTVTPGRSLVIVKCEWLPRLRCARSIGNGIQRSAGRRAIIRPSKVIGGGNSNVWGMTPTTSYGRSLSKTLRPMTSRAPPKRVCQNP